MRQFFLGLAIAASLSAGTTLSFDGTSPSWTTLHGAAAPDPAVTHEGQMSMRLESAGRDSRVQSAPVPLTIGKPYELSGWIRTEKLAVHDLDRSPIATGAALTMASMPFDVQSESVAGSHDWTRVHLRFTATRAQDSLVLTVAYGGTFDGKAWFSGVSLNEAPANIPDAWPAPSAVTTYGPAYRYPVAGWIYLHVEGKPYDRGYQHGRLMAKEIPQYMERCAAELDPVGKNKSWDLARTTVSALFLHGFDQEILQEMKGIADGASDAGARFENRPIDLTDIAVVNTTVELGDLKDALAITPNGLEGLRLIAPNYGDRKREHQDHCSAFAATGPATRDGRMVIGHITWWPLTLAEQTNVMIDIQPSTGHRVLMQSYPGGIESGTDWYQNDAGIVLSETTINQSPFNVNGTPVAYRARHAIQYGDSIDKVVEILSTKNNGLYTNEWLLGDAKTNEIALFELGTYKSRLYRSSKNDWFGGTEGFYWGDNNAKDLSVRLEETPDPNSPPSYIPYVPTNRDLKWQDLYHEYKGKIDEQFGFMAFHTAPLVSPTAMDAKVTTADMASRLMVWAEFGRSNQTERLPSRVDSDEYAANDGLYPSGYRLISAGPAPDSKPATAKTWIEDPPRPQYMDRLWKGWVLPAADADVWFASGSAAYYEDLESRDLSNAMAAHWAQYRSLSSISAPNAKQQFELETHKGALFLDQLRRNIGDDRFFKLMSDFFAAHKARAVTAQSFLDAAGVTFALPADPGGPAYLLTDIRERLASAILVYGTQADAGANRYAAEQLEKRFYLALETAVPIRKDFEVTDADLRTHDVIFVGRPETNSALAAIDSKLGLDYSGGLFRIAGQDHASETEAIAFAASNPLDPHHMILILAGNSALETVLLSKAEFDEAQYATFDAGKEIASGFLATAPTLRAR
ncbi:MAG TPA: C45 family autoproteolytic acyltransferase/hydrolase [Bryobacteraceae bacterium]|nr:C45 family autoproteolytic acyltransferase/hydrolase [Bryobacteraceae bacterium]